MKAAHWIRLLAALLVLGAGFGVAAASSLRATNRRHTWNSWHAPRVRLAEQPFTIATNAPTTTSTTNAPTTTTTDAPRPAPVVHPPAAPQPAPPAPAPPPPSTPEPLGVGGSWALTFSDEFSGTALDASKWATTSSAEADHGQGNPGNQQLEWDQAQNCSVGNGVLSITAKPDNITSPSGQHYNWSSCLITSTPSYAFRYGYIEERAQFPANKGFWPAFWTWQAPGGPYIESDVYEYYSDNHTRLYLTQHSGSGGGCNITLPFDPSAGMHVYGMAILPTGSDWYVDGVKVCHAAGTSTGMTNIIDDNFVYSGNGNRGLQPASGSIGVKTIDYIRAWQQ